MSEQDRRYWPDSPVVAAVKANATIAELQAELAEIKAQFDERGRIIAEWQNINVGLAAELKRERERSEARRVHVAALAAKLKAAGVQA